MTSIIIDKRYCGPPNSGNGGYVCGRLAGHIPGGAEVTLRAPPPLDKQLDVVATDDGSWELRDGATVVATGRPASVELTRLEKASFDEASAAELLTPVKPHEHMLPTCFVCGPARAKGDGLRIFAGPLVRQSCNASAVLAATWTPDPTLTAEDGFVAPEFLWSALDCPTGYASSHDRESGSFDRTPRTCPPAPWPRPRGSADRWCRRSVRPGVATDRAARTTAPRWSMCAARNGSTGSAAG